MSSPPNPGPQAAFTLIEMMIVVVILAILFSIAVPSYMGLVQGARESSTIREMEQIIQDIEIYKANNNMELPLTLADVGHGGRLDAWGNPYVYLNFAAGSTGKGKGKGKGKNTGAKIGEKRKDKNLVPLNTDYDFYSMGPDGKSQGPLTAKASRDDIVRADDGEFLGVAADY